MKIESGIGQSLPRIEGEDKVTGRLTYLGDLQISGMLHGKLLLYGPIRA